MNWLKNSRFHRRALLISPYERGKIASNDAVLPFPSLALPLLAAAFPNSYHVRIIDERISRVKGTEPADIVFMTALTSTAPRAYNLAEKFMSRGIPVVMGGVHATALPEEARKTATSVVRGEAESMVSGILSDFENEKLSPLYTNPCFEELKHLPLPALNLLTWRHRFFLSPLQTSRGCPHNCNFCAVPKISGKKIRLKSVAEVEKELIYLRRFRSKNLFVVDDNFTLNKERALTIMQLFKKYGFQWMGFSNLAACDDEGYLHAMADSGCISLFIGFESLHYQDYLKKNKSFGTPSAMARAAQKIHACGIGIQGSFVFGFDEDTRDVFHETVSFVQENSIELPNFCILTPFPGTPLYDDMKRQGRIINQDWSCYDMNHVVFQPKNMSCEELQQGYAWALKYTASPTSIFSRVWKRKSAKLYFLTAGFSLHRAQTRLARSLWNPGIQALMQEQQFCTC